MEMQRLEALPPPPGVIASLQAGFSIVSSHIALILLPLFLDVTLWLGPRLSVGKSYEAFFNTSLNVLRQNGFPARDLAMYTENAPLIIGYFERLNWLGWLRTLPIGIPALMLGLPETIPVPTPLGLQGVIQLPSFMVVASTLLLLTFAGWLGGGWYFRSVAGASLGEEEPAIGLIWTWLQTILLSVVWMIGLMVIAFPILFLIGLLFAIHPLLAQAAFFIMLFFLFWLVVPLFFMPHGIFVRRQNAFLSILSSLRMSRFTLPNSSMFVLSVFLLSRGLSYLWLVPSSDSWLVLIGIAGHAFISTALLSASFVYYRNMNHWLQTVFEQFQKMSQRSSIRKA
jgi:hypothetical protein